MKISSERLNYRPFTYDDYDDLYLILSNETVCKYLPGDGKKSDDEINKWLQYFVRTFNDEQGNKLFAITVKGNDQVIGYGGLGYVKEFDSIEIMYGFNELVWGKGYATEASKRFKELAKDLKMTFLIALADINNIPSQKILLKTGYKEIKQMPLWGLDVYYYEMDLT